jgi:transposase-like protein
LCVTWYTSFKLSLRDLVIIMADRGIPVTHTTILRWVRRYLPEFEKRWRRYARPIGGSWRMDETYIKVHGQWVCLYRAVAKAGQTVDFFLSRNRDVNAAKLFLRGARKNTRVPKAARAQTAGTPADHRRAVRERQTDAAALPAAPYEACDQRSTRVTSMSLVRYRTNDYSVPVEWGHREVLVKGIRA